MASSEPPVTPITSLDDPRAIQILTAEHSSVTTARALAFEEAFTRAGMFLNFLATSLIALALLAQAMNFDQDFLAVAGIVLAFDFVIGLASYGRIAGANFDDLRALQGIARIRHGYVQVAPILKPYFTMATHDDVDSVTTDYNVPHGGPMITVLYALTTSLGMIGLIVAMVGGVLASVIALLARLSGGSAVWIGLAVGLVVFVLLVLGTVRAVSRQQVALQARYPAPPPEESAS